VLASNRSFLLTPLLEASTADQVLGTSCPSGLTVPIPVMTTRRLLTIRTFIRTFVQSPRIAPSC
jgi:hypothetical protein